MFKFSAIWKVKDLGKSVGNPILSGDKIKNMLSCQKDLFKLDPGVTYLNCAYMSPLLKKVEQVGHEMISLKCNPQHVKPAYFFEVVKSLKKAFAQLINLDDDQRVAIIPSVSYGIANAVKNISIEPGGEILLLSEQFPSNYYSWERLAEDNQAKIEIADVSGQNPTQDVILSKINERTAVIALSHAHWADGTPFDLKTIRIEADKVGAYVIVDGTQSVGALPFDVQELKPDALICAGYKWLMGPYSMGCAYYNEKFDQGIPIEENWINRAGSEHFAGLVNYQSEYQPKASRYSVGEQSNFILAPMLTIAIEQILEWQPIRIQQYCRKISQNFVSEIKNMGLKVEEEAHRCGHLFGIRLPETWSVDRLKSKFQQKNVFVSIRGNAIRVAPHLYNDEGDFGALLQCFKEVVPK